MEFEDLKALSQMRYQKEQQTLKKLLVQESAIRADIDRLNQHEARAQAVPFADTAAPRALGADILWKQWLSKTRAALNVDLARVLAQKEQHLSRVRLAYGKVLVSDSLSLRNDAEKSKKRRRHMLNAAIVDMVQK